MALAWDLSACLIAALSTAFDRIALPRLLVLDSAIAADASWLGAVTRAEAFLLFFGGGIAAQPPLRRRRRAVVRPGWLIVPLRSPSMNWRRHSSPQNRCAPSINGLRHTSHLSMSYRPGPLGPPRPRLSSRRSSRRSSDRRSSLRRSFRPLSRPRPRSWSSSRSRHSRRWAHS